MMANGAETESGGVVLTIANCRRTLTDSDVFSQSLFQKGTNPIRGERRFTYSERLDCCRVVCND